MLSQDLSQLTEGELLKKKMLHKSLLIFLTAFEAIAIGVIIYFFMKRGHFSAASVAVFAVVPAIVMNAVQVKKAQQELDRRKS